ncbi:MAG: polysaccharide deacetylase family protein [Phycisphaerae bacterium]
MNEDSGGFLQRWFGRKREATPTVDSAGLASRGTLAPMEPGPILTVAFNFEHGGRHGTASGVDYALERTVSCLDQRGIHATFHCPARQAETAHEQLAHIRDAGHEIACHGYDRESSRELVGEALERMLTLCQEAMSDMGVQAIGFHPPAECKSPDAYRAIARHGFRYISELSREDNPRLLISKPALLLRMPIAANDSGYARHPEQPRHVLEKHRALIERVVRKEHYLALSYHIWILGEEPARFDDLQALLDTAQSAGVKFRTFEQALPETYRPKPKSPSSEA